MYQSATRSLPSGLTCTNSVMTSFKKPHRLLVVAARHLIDHLAELLRAEHFGGVEAAVDPDDGLSLLRERARLRVRQPLGVREARRDLLVARQLLVVLGRRHDRHELRASLGRLAHLLDHDPRRFLRQLSPVRGDLDVVREEVVVAEVGAELFLGCRDVGLRRGGRGRERATWRPEPRARVRFDAERAGMADLLRTGENVR